MRFGAGKTPFHAIPYKNWRQRSSKNSQKLQDKINPYFTLKYIKIPRVESVTHRNDILNNVQIQPLSDWKDYQSNHSDYTNCSHAEPWNQKDGLAVFPHCIDNKRDAGHPEDDKHKLRHTHSQHVTQCRVMTIACQIFAETFKRSIFKSDSAHIKSWNDK